MPRNQATLLCHHGHGLTHYDLIVARGQSCPTWRMEYVRRQWVWSPAAAHRRYYLHFCGPVRGGRGTVKPVWRGLITWSRSNWRFGPWDFRRLGLRVVPLTQIPRLCD